jgi:hypothetical protein
VQPGCILGGLRFRSVHEDTRVSSDTTIRFFKFVWYFQQQVFREFFLQNDSNQRVLRGGRRLRSSGNSCPTSSAFVLPLKIFNSSRFSEKNSRNNYGGTEGAPRGDGPSLFLFRHFAIFSLRNGSN